MLSLKNNYTSNSKIHNSDTQCLDPDIEMGLDFIKLQKKQQSERTHKEEEEEKEKENMSVLSKILNYIYVRVNYNKY